MIEIKFKQPEHNAADNYELFSAALGALNALTLPSSVIDVIDSLLNDAVERESTHAGAAMWATLDHLDDPSRALRATDTTAERLTAVRRLLKAQACFAEYKAAASKLGAKS